MQHFLRAILAPAALAFSSVISPSAHAADASTHRPAVDVVLALDVSGSMSGLIDSAKQRLWDVVNEFNQAQPQPDLRVAVLSYGNPSYGRRGGFVRIDQPLTRDLDAVNEALFGFATNGGSEYVARVIARAGKELDWSDDPQALRVLFVAGNESAAQDPELDLHRVARVAHRRGIVVNTIFCGRDGDGAGEVPASWRSAAQHGGGMYASIDQNASAVAAIAAPQDETLRVLNEKLNETYLPYGDKGEKRRENQARQDSNAASMSGQAAAARTVTKASGMYRASEWDLVDALQAGTALESLDEAALPAPMRAMEPAQREAYVKKKSEERAALRKEIGDLAAERARHIKAERAKTDSSEARGLSDALKQSIRSAAQRKGFSFSE